jgi:hypothetical protein
MGDAVAFWQAIYRQWLVILLGSGFAAGLFIWTWFGGPTPMWLALAVFLTSIFLAVYLAGRGEHQRRLALERRMRPALEISGVAHHAPTDDHRRVRVRNVSARTMRFSVRLDATEPADIGHHVPADLRVSGQTTRGPFEIPAGAEQLVDVFIDRGPREPLRLVLMGATDAAHEHQIPRERRYELKILAYPAFSQEEVSAAVARWFYIVPQSDGGVIFTADGVRPVITPAGSATG